MTEDIIKELVLMLENDQEDLKRFRTGAFTLEQIRTKVKVRTARLKEILADAFPNIKNTGVQAYTAALVMVLHSGDHDFKILILEGKSQRYGTQFVMKKGNQKFYSRT